MNIEQMLRDAIESKTAKILKEEYGIEMSKEIADKLPKDDQDCGDYQIRLTNVGDHKIRVVKAVFNSMDVDLKTAKTLVDHAPSVIITGLCKEAAVDISNELAKLGAGSSVESVIPTGTTSKHVYQLVLTNRSSGVHREDIANIVEQIEGSKPYANFVLTSNAPLVIARGLNYFAAVELKKSIVDKGGDVVIEEITKID